MAVGTGVATGPPTFIPQQTRLHFWQTAKFRRRVIPWLFVLPILLINVLVVAGPAVAAFYYAMTEWSGIGHANFIGLDNFRTLFFHDPSFRHAFKNNLVWLCMFLTVPIAMALIAASLLAPIRRGALFFRMTLFLPYVLPSVITAFIWRTLMNPDRGLGAQAAKWGIGGLDRAFLGDPKTVLPAIAFIDNWHWWGFLMVLFLAAMQNVPADLYEAARLDGANRWQEFRDVTIPGIRPTLIFMLLMTSIWSFLTFDYIWILTQGGPAGASEVLAVLVQKNAFLRFEAGYAAAIGVTMSFFVGVVISIFLILRKRGWEMSAQSTAPRRGFPGIGKRRAASHLPNYLILSLLTIFAIGPMLIMFFNSLKSKVEIGRNPLGFPSTFVWQNYTNAWRIGNYSTTTKNSGILVVLTVAGVLILGGMAAYSLAKLDLPGNGIVMLYLLIGSSLPLQLFLVPLFFLWKSLSLNNSLPGLALIYIAINAPLAIFLLRSYMVQLPRDFEDAARVDGAGELKIFLGIVVPLTWPGFLTVGLVVALNVWNEFLLATVFLTNQEHFTVVTSYYKFTSQFSRDWALTSAAAVMMVFPVIAIFLLLQRRFVEGLTQGGVKG